MYIFVENISNIISVFISGDDILNQQIPFQNMYKREPYQNKNKQNCTAKIATLSRIPKICKFNRQQY